MLGLYPDTFVIGHKCYNMLSIQSELKLQKELQNSLTNNVCSSKK